MTHPLCAAGLGVTLALVVGGGFSALPMEAASTLWVRATGERAATLLHLQPGFATVLRADHRVDTVAIGDPRLVTATVVRRGQDAFDLVLQPQVKTGTTNMVVWYGELATAWTLEIGPGPQTADIVHVVTAPARATAEPPAQGTPPSAQGVQTSSSSAVPPRPETPPAPASPQNAVPDTTRGLQPGRANPGAAGSSVLEVRQSVGEVTGAFQVRRVPDGVMITYRITNDSRADLVIRPGSVLVRVNGRIVPYGMARDGIDRGRPEILPRGATENGVIDASSAETHSVQLVFSLFPSGAPDERGRRAALPLVFQLSFSEVDRLAISPAP